MRIRSMILVIAGVWLAGFTVPAAVATTHSVTVGNNILAPLGTEAGPQPIVVPPGVDLWLTQPDCQSSSMDFSGQPIPPDFFGPGSDPFTGSVSLQGLPLPTNPPNVLGPTDGIVERIDTLKLPQPGDSDQVPIEIIALSLTSCQPITVTYMGGVSTEQWQVDITLSHTTPQSQGQMTVNRDCDDGGTFSASLPVTPRLIFTRVNPPSTGPTLAIDDGIARPLEGSGHWSSVLPPDPILSTFSSDGTTQVDHDLDPLTPDIMVPPSDINFFAGLRLLPCDLSNPSLCGGIAPALFSGADMQITCLIPAVADAVIGATCLSGGECVITSSTCAASIGGDYAGDGTFCEPFICLPPPLSGISINQVDFVFDSALVPFSIWGRLTLDVPTVATTTSIPSGYINMFTDKGWVVQNLWYDSLPNGWDSVTYYFNLADTNGLPVSELSAYVSVSTLPVEFFNDGPRSLYPITPFAFGAEGRGPGHTSFPGEPLLAGVLHFDPLGITEATIQPSGRNVQAAANQCFPMAIANSLQYLEDRYGLPVPHYHGPGLKGDTTLVGQLDQAANRQAASRTNGSGVSDSAMLTGKFKYLRDNGLERKLITKHQDGFLAAGDFTAHHQKSKDESVNGKVTWAWICNELKKGEDVEICWSYYDDSGNVTGGHAVRVFACGKTLGVPWIGYIHDARQTNQGDPTDTLGLECVITPMVDLDNDSTPNAGSRHREIDLAVSESADTDRDGVTNELDNAPGMYNPGQEDLDGNGVADVLESPFLESNDIAIPALLSGGTVTQGPFPNPGPIIPVKKDMWFVGNATNPSGTDSARVAISFEFWIGNNLVSSPTVDTTRLLAGQTREVFGAYTIEVCPDSVSIMLTALDGQLSNITGTFNHICYGFGTGCCIGITGNVDGDPDEIVDIGDLTALIGYLFIPPNIPPVCMEEGNVDGDPDGIVDIGDLTALIGYLFIPPNVLPAPCQ